MSAAAEDFKSSTRLLLLLDRGRACGSLPVAHAVKHLGKSAWVVAWFVPSFEEAWSARWCQSFHLVTFVAADPRSQTCGRYKPLHEIAIAVDKQHISQQAIVTGTNHGHILILGICSTDKAAQLVLT